MTNKLNEEIIKSIWQQLSLGHRIPLFHSPIKVEFHRDQHGTDEILFYFDKLISLNIESSSGFDVELQYIESIDKTILKLIRTSTEEDREMFLTLSQDLSTLARQCEGLESDEIATLIADRITAWQTFMHASGTSFSIEKEVGLYGELTILKLLLEKGWKPQSLTQVWTGPMHGARDFTFLGGHAIEVKTSLSDCPFQAKIDSIAQLDTTDFPHLSIATVKLSENTDSANLLDLCDEIRSLLAKRLLISEFDTELLSLGLRPEYIFRSLKELKVDYIRLFKGDTVPRLIPGTVPGLVSARYVVQLLNEENLPLTGIEEEELNSRMNEFLSHI